MGTDLSMHDGPRALALRSFQDFIQFGEFAANSQFAPTSMRGKPADCTLATILGYEIGLGAMAALQGIAVVNGKPSVFGDAMKAVVMASPLCEWIEESVEGDGDAAVATCSAKRRGYPQPVVYTFSMAEAKRAGLTGKDSWKAYPKRMLQMRARGFALRDAFPDLLRGIISREEAEDYPDQNVAAPPPKAPVKRLAKKPAAESKAVDAVDDVVQVVGVLERAMVKIAAAESPEELASYQERADQYLLDKTINKSEHDQITAAVDERADFIRTQRKIGGADGAV